MHLARAQRVSESSALVESERAELGFIANHMRRQENEQVVLLFVGSSAGKNIAQNRYIGNPGNTLALNAVIVRHQSTDDGGAMILHHHCS